ncbi:MAG TPA: FkbM family methyltransferase [Stenotrophomonas sp.]|nr:FkbM family methyltransferase [Stenotrophomonas sp.]
MDTQNSAQKDATERRLTPIRYGISTLLPQDNAVTRSLMRYGEWMEQELDLLGSFLQSGETVLEFGAEFAAHTLWLASAVGESGSVHVVEPHRLNLQRACANLALNGVLNTYTHTAWLGGNAGSVELLPPGAEPQRVRSISVDSLGLEALHLLKINIPGTLSSVLAGADETLRQHRPVLYLRLGPAVEQAIQDVRTLKELGYRCWSHLPYMFNPENFNGSEENLFPGWVHQNLVAAPIESRLEFERLREV